jgi:hypothetical protein
MAGVVSATHRPRLRAADKRIAMPRLSPVVFAAFSGLALSACAGSGRFDGLPSLGWGSRPPSAAAAPRAEPAPMAAPSAGVVTSEPLPPPSYPGGAPAQVAGVPGEPTQVTPLPPTIPGGSPQPAQGQAVASLPPSAPPAPPSQPVVRSSSASVGTWTARDATGATCRVTLSSASALDLNKASASGCANRDLQRVNAWKQEGGEIYLYSAGAVVARVPAGGGAGALSRSGAPLTMTR